MKRLFARAALMVLAVSGTACSVTFDGVSGVGNPDFTILTVTEQGQTLVFTGPHFHAIGQPALCQYAGCTNNGTVYLAAEGGLPLPMNMARQDGGLFGLVSFQVAQMFINDGEASSDGLPNATTVSVVGTVSGGGSVSGNCLVPDTGFATCTPPSTFTNLTSVTFLGSTASGGAGGIAIDNISHLPLGSPAAADADGYSFTPAPRRESGPPDPVSRN